MIESQIIVTVCVEKDGDGFYAYAPALKGLHVGGDTEDEALKNATDGVILYLESLVRHGEPFPRGPHLKIKYHNDPKIQTNHYNDPLTKEISVLWTSQMILGDKSRALQQRKSFAL